MTPKQGKSSEEGTALPGVAKESGDGPMYGDEWNDPHGGLPMAAPLVRSGNTDRKILGKRPSVDALFVQSERNPELPSRKVQRYGWVRDIPDLRDHLYAAPLFTNLPLKCSILKACPAIYDQGQLGSCTANALAAAVQFERIRQGLEGSGRVPSRLFIYYNERLIEGDVAADRGAQLRDGIKAIASKGACFEGTEIDNWPYDESKFATKPSAHCYEAASSDKVLSYSRLVPRLDQLKGCIASGYPFVFGFTCYQSFESEAVAKTGNLELPARNETAVGAHAVLAVGYNDSMQRFLIRNSWGAQWGQKGYFTMPYAYLTDSDLCSDFWTVRLVSAPG